MATQDPHGAHEAHGAGTDPEDRAALLLDRWSAHRDAGAAPEPAPPRSGDGVAPKHAGPAAPSPPAPIPPAPIPTAPSPQAPSPQAPSPGRATDAVAASREVVDALQPAPAPAPEAPAPPPAAPAPTAAGTGPSLNVEFVPKLAVRRLVGLLLLLCVVATVGAAGLAYDDPRPITVGGAGTLLVLTLVLYAVRAGSAPTYLAIRSGQLEVRRGRVLEKFDLTSRFTRIEVVGTPGRPGWRVLFGRFGRAPLEISAAVVDPQRFTAELERYRPRG